MDDLISIKRKEFIDIFEQKENLEKQLVHYNSVLNISKKLITYEDPKADPLKVGLIDFFQELEKRNYSIESKSQSLDLYKYLLPIVRFLIRREQFVAGGDLRLLIIIGFIIDLVLHFIFSDYYYPIFTVLFLLLGIHRRKNAKRHGKYAAMFW